jgi:hypothetical protein
MARLCALMLVADAPGFNPAAGEAAYSLAAAAQSSLAKNFSTSLRRSCRCNTGFSFSSTP